jgi:hypothetical protein
MKCAVALSVLLAGSSLLLGDSPNPSPSQRQPSATLLDELVRMTRAGSSDRAVLAYAQAHRRELPSEVSAASLRWLRDSGVSDTVVRYMSAFDVRVPDDGSGMAGGETELSDENGRSTRAGTYPSENGEYGDAGRYALNDSSGYGYPYAESQPYADYGYGYGPGYGPGYGYGYGYDYYPYFGYPYFYSPFVIIGRGESFRRHFHSDHQDHHMDHGGHGGHGGHGDHHNQGDHRFDGGHQGNAVHRGGSGDAWRERGVQTGRGGSMAPGSRGSARPALTRGFGTGAQPARGNGVGPRGFGAGPQPARGHGVGPRGFSAPGPAHRNPAAGYRGTPGGFRTGGGSRTYASAGAPHSGSAGGFGRGAGSHGGGRGH